LPVVAEPIQRSTINRSAYPGFQAAERVATKRQYLTTAPDGLRQNNLLSLRECRG
jgi:hypothetical protein